MKNKDNIFIGLDPSFNHSGFTVIYSRDDNKEIRLGEVGVDINKKSTRDIFWKINDVNELLLNNLDLSVRIKDSKLVSEIFCGMEVTRAVTAWMASELYALDYDLYMKIKQYLSSSIKVNLYSNASLSKSLLGHKSSEKDKTIYLIEDQILPIFKKHKYKIDKIVTTKTKYQKDEKGKWLYRETITDGAADSMIYALRQLVLYTDDVKLKEDLLQVLPGLANLKEME